ncbi:hypothetical protein SASPL_114178 [Salvia splendens]|uniref:Uncharacterized protein n=1 Tax=Salvia splendens TaxID=180675 RepID=A0A8X8Y1D1_SALSN|nr:hypothetical protein SASPL_114178 [Salvia splendens]
MDKLREFFKKTIFYARVLSGYEERRIRSYRLQLQKRLQQAEVRKAALNKVPEQIILSEVRKMVQEMQALNKKLEDTDLNLGFRESCFHEAVCDSYRRLREAWWIVGYLLWPIFGYLVKLIIYKAKILQEAAIEDYFKPLDKEAEVIMKAQLEGEEKTMREMVATMQRQALLEKAEADAQAQEQALTLSKNSKADKEDEELETECVDKRAGMR